MTFNEAKQLLKSKNVYFIKESETFGTLEEYKAKLSDLWADNYSDDDDPDAASFDEILAVDPDAEELVKSYFERDLDPTEAVEELYNTLNSTPDNTEDYGEVSEEDADLNALDLDDDSYDETDLENFDEDNFDATNFIENDLQPEEELNFDEAVKYLKQRGYTLNEDAQLLLEDWYDNIGLTAEDKTFVKRVIQGFDSYKVKTKVINGHRIKGGYMLPNARSYYYRSLERVLQLAQEHHASGRTITSIQNRMNLMLDQNWYQFIRDNNPDLDPDDIPHLFGTTALGETDDTTPEEAAQRAEEDRAEELRREEEERIAREEAERAERERRRRENPEPEDLISDEEFEETPESITTRQVTRHRMRTVNRNFTDHYSYPQSVIKINIDVTDDEESKNDVDEIVSAIKDKLRIAFEDDEGKFAMCKVDAAVVDVEEDGQTKQEYHVVISMPAEIKTEISRFAQRELEDAFPFVNSEHPEDSVYEFDNTGNRNEIDDETYEYNEPVVQPARRRPQTTVTRRVNRTPRWRVYYKVADENGRPTNRIKAVIVPAATEADAKNKVENPEDIDSAYATNVAQVIRAERI